jgi:two-component system, OmpR family, sensor histidine kinase TctE
MSLSRPSPRSIRQRLLLWLIPPLVLLWGLSVIVDYRLTQHPAEVAFDRALLDSALALAANLKTDGHSRRLSLSPETEAVLRFDGTDRIYFAVYDEQRRLLAGDGELTWRSPGTSNPGFFSDTIGAEAIRVVVYLSGEKNHPTYIEVAETTHKRRRLSEHMLGALIWPNLLLIAAAAVLITFGVGNALSPLLRLRDEVAARSSRDLQALSTAHAPSEVLPLIDSLNRLFELLARQAEAQQRFLANAAHQLKTPLAALQTQLELAGMDSDPASARARLKQLEAVTERIAHLTRQLLALARSEPGASMAAQMRTVDLHAAAEQMASSYLDFSLTRNIDLGFELAPATVNAVPWLLQELLGNLVDNALRYTPPGGVVTVRCGSEVGHAFFEVEDDGPGIPAAERDRVFDRFYRANDAIGDGCGLGLAIVREIADVHGAEIIVSGGANRRGAKFTVRFASAA